MKQLSLVVALTVFCIQLGFSQIKKQYKDKVFNQTTVLVKEDKISDIDILNSMDLDEIGMDQIIQIKTAPEQTKPAKELTATQIETIQEETKITLPEEPVVQEAVEETVVEVRPAIVPIAQKEIKTTSRAANTAVKAASKTSRTSSASRVSKKSSKSKIRRFKKVKRKKFRSGKKLSCYKF